MAKKKAVACKRPYALGKRLELSQHKRASILAAAKTHLETKGLLQFTMDSLAGESGVTRQTVHNLFGTKAAILEALFDQLASAGGMERMREVMQEPSADRILSRFVEVCTDFWRKERELIRRIHGIAAIDPEWSAAVNARNRRRQSAASRVIDLLGKENGEKVLNDRIQKIATLYALTSFEFFDSLSESCGNAKEAAHLVHLLAKVSLASEAR
jgi:AcrR family transcriptional regulator